MLYSFPSWLQRATDEELKKIQNHLEKNPDVPLDKPEQ